jgi:VanZ family protein
MSNVIISVFRKNSANFWISVVLILLFPFFFIGGPKIYSTSLFRVFWDCGHLIFFAGLVLLLHTKKPISGWRYCVFLSAFVFIVGSIIEVIQHYTGRDGNWLDVLRDLVGTWFAMFWLQKNNRWAWFGRIITTLFLLPTIQTIFLSAWSQFHLMRQFPEFANFESSIDARGWKGKVERSALVAAQGQYSLKIHFNTDKYSTASFREFFNSWNDYTFLSMDIYNPDITPLTVKLRIHDSRHELNNNFSDRFNKDIQLESGWNSISIPLDDIKRAPASRPLDLGAITTLAIFTMQLPEPRDIYVDNVSLR